MAELARREVKADKFQVPNEREKRGRAATTHEIEKL